RRTSTAAAGSSHRSEGDEPHRWTERPIPMTRKVASRISGIARLARIARRYIGADAAGCRPLRLRLLGPIVLLILLAAGGWSIVNELSTRRQAATLVELQGRAVLEGISRRVSEQRQAKEVAAQLLADQHTLALLVAWADPVELAELLAPLQAKLDLQRVTVYAPNGTEILHM